MERETAAACATAAAVVDGAALAALAVMYAVEVPKGGPFVFGTANDVLGVAGQVLVMPVMAELSAQLPEGALRDAVLRAGLAGCAVGAASGALLVARVLPFAPSTAISLAAAEVQAGWMVATNHLLLRSTDAPPALAGLGRFGRLVGGAVIVGGAVAAAALGLPRDSPARRVGLGVGVAAGTVGWLAWPVWLHQVGRYLRSTPRPR